MITVSLDRTWEDWRQKARDLLAQNVSPQNIQWLCDPHEFPLGTPYSPSAVASELKLPREFVLAAMFVSVHRDDSTWALLYKIAWRIQNEERQLMRIGVDPDIRELESRRHSVGRDLHKMHAFVRFRELKTDDGVWYQAWYRPDHRITRLAAPFFKDRFNGMKWVIMTEDETVAWDQKELSFLAGVPECELPPDHKEDLWKTYYSSIFNPARVKVAMMKKEMAVRYWDRLPESQLIAQLLADAPARVAEFQRLHGTLGVQRSWSTWEEWNENLDKCRACGRCEAPPQKSADDPQAKFVFVLSDPNALAREELIKRLVQENVNLADCYITYAVRSANGKKPRPPEIAACRPWLQSEIKLIKPQEVICIGKEAYLAVHGKLQLAGDIVRTSPSLSEAGMTPAGTSSTLRVLE